jgi:hypothetical protein
MITGVRRETSAPIQFIYHDSTLIYILFFSLQCAVYLRTVLPAVPSIIVASTFSVQSFDKYSSAVNLFACKYNTVTQLTTAIMPIEFAPHVITANLASELSLHSDEGPFIFVFINVADGFPQKIFSSDC